MLMQLACGKAAVSAPQQEAQPTSAASGSQASSGTQSGTLNEEVASADGSTIRLVGDYS